MVKRFGPQWGFHLVSPRGKQRPWSFIMVKLLPSLFSSFHTKVQFCWHGALINVHDILVKPQQRQLYITWYYSYDRHHILLAHVPKKSLNCGVNITSKVRMFSCVSNKPISRSFTNCVAYSFSNNTANFDIFCWWEDLKKSSREKLQEIILSGTAGSISPLTK